MDAEMDAEKAAMSLKIYEEETREEGRDMELLIGHEREHCQRHPFLPHRVTQLIQMVMRPCSQSLICQVANNLDLHPHSTILPLELLVALHHL